MNCVEIVFQGRFGWNLSSDFLFFSSAGVS